MNILPLKCVDKIKYLEVVVHDKLNKHEHAQIIIPTEKQNFLNGIGSSLLYT